MTYTYHCRRARGLSRTCIIAGRRNSSRYPAVAPGMVVIFEAPRSSSCPLGPLMTVTEAATFLHVSTRTVRRLLERRELRKARIGRTDGHVAQCFAD